MAVFDGVRYWLAESLPPDRRALNSNYLNLNGGEPADNIDAATHIITNTYQFQGWKRLDDGELDAAVVTETWVDRSIVLGKAQPTQFYSANPAMVFSGIVACATDLTPPDMEVISAGITALGGQWRNGLTRDVTHLFALGPGSDKYETAMHFQADTRMKVVLPHWFDDAVTLGVGGLPTDAYEWPDPKYLRPMPGGEDVIAGGDAGADGNGKLISAMKGQVSAEKKKILQSVGWTGVPAGIEAIGTGRDVWTGRKILLSLSLELSGGRREAVETGIRRAGGVVVAYKKAGGEGDVDEEVRKVQDADVLITRYRHGVAYLKALKAEKMIGTLAWLFHVESTGVLTPPTDQLLHYPIPKTPIPGFSGHKITVTNYTGESREYLKRLILAMGAEFTPNMSGSNTVVIAAYISGLKTTKAVNWSIPIVNHIWLEDCFVQWRSLSVGSAKYIEFPPGTDFAVLLGERGVGRSVQLDLEREEDLRQEIGGMNASGREVNEEHVVESRRKETETPKGKGKAKDKEQGKESETSKGKAKATPKVGREGPARIATSAKDAREVEEAVGLFRGDADGDGSVRMDIDANVADEDRDAQMAVDKEVSPKSPQKKRKARKIQDEDSEVEVVEKAKRPKSRLVRRASTRKQQEDEEGEERDQDEPGLSIVKMGGAVVVLSDLDDESDVEEVVVRPRAKPASKPKGKALTAQAARDTDDDDSDDGPPVKKPGPINKGKAKELVVMSPARTPRRVVSVVLPTGNSSKKKSGPPKRTESLRVEADEALAGSSPKRGRPAKGSGLNRESFSGARRSIGSSPSPLARTPLKRAAHLKASAHLHDVMMPDMNNYAQEKRRGFKGKDSDRLGGGSRERTTGKGRKRPSDAADHLESAHEEAERKKKRRIGAGASRVKSAEAESDRDSDDERRPKKATKEAHVTVQSGESDADSCSDVSEKKSSSAAKHRISKTDPKTIRLMTTQVTLPEDVIKSLTKMGVRLTTRPAECTHLVVPQLVRTEKFLCAIAVAPLILKADWALESASTKQILPEEKYLLEDSKNETKYNFKLSDALRRAKAVRGRLFDKMTFYVTPKVPVEVKLLKNVVSAGGGQVVTTTPTVRILKANENRHVVSCPADTSIWKPLADNGYTIYSPELLLTGALRQELDWDDNANKVQ